MKSITPLNIITVVGTRPEIIRLSRIISELDNSKSINHILIHTGQNYDYELNEIFFKDLGIRKPDYFLDASGKNASETIGNILIKIDPIFEQFNPDALLILGDTNSCLSSIAAKKRKIPIFHIEAGNRCFDQRVPEETNRKIVDHIADINLTYSDISREYLIREGLPGDRIIKLGSPMFEVLNFYSEKIFKSSILNKLSLKKNKFFLVSTHREENISETYKFKSLIGSLNQLAINYKMPIIVSTHPRTRNKLNEQNIETNSLIKFIEPLGFTDYNNLQVNACVVLSDSGTISEESSILNFRALNIRESHERPEAMEEASVMMVGLDSDNILRGVEEVVLQDTSEKRNFHLVSDYSNPNVSSKVVRIILSYTSYINRVVWQKK